jgi:hypothetical protein
MKLPTLLALSTSCLAGPFPAGIDGIPATDPRLTLWATAAVVERGPADILFPDGALAGFGSDSDATGPANATPDDPYTAVSLGDGGTTTLTFDPPFQDIPGPDFAVFENAFGGAFLELAFVEVSSDGETFYRFPATSLTRTDLQVGTFGGIDPSDLHNLAGKHPAGFGTPFDLAELRHHPALDLQRVTHVRIIDVIGTIDPAHASRDAAGRIINDPYPTPFFTGGFDLDAVGAFSATSNHFAEWAAAQNLPADWNATTNHHPLGILFTTGNSKLSLDLTSSPVLRFTRLAYRPQPTLHLEGSTNLTDWKTLATSANGSTTTEDPAITLTETGTHAKSIAVHLPPGDPHRYFRLSATP